jgi:hypothetical protein
MNANVAEPCGNDWVCAHLVGNPLCCREHGGTKPGSGFWTAAGVPRFRLPGFLGSQPMENYLQTHPVSPVSTAQKRGPLVPRR